jgi:hypothetical protein
MKIYLITSPLKLLKKSELFNDRLSGMGRYNIILELIANC